MSRSWTPPPVSAGANAILKRYLRDAIFLPGSVCLILALAACDAAAPRGNSALLPPGSDQRPVEAGQTGRGLGADGLPALDPSRGVNVGVESLFTEDIKDPITRIKRLENAVLEMRRDYEATLPAIKRLIGIEKDMQTLMAQLEILTNGDAPREAAPREAAPPVPAVPLTAVTTESTLPAPSVLTPPAAVSQNDPAPPVPAVPDARSQAVSPQDSPVAIPALKEGDAVAPAEPSIPPAETPPAKAQAPPAQAPPAQAPPAALPPVQTIQAPQPQSSNGLAASGVRLGESAGKTRLVIDLNRSASHRTDLDNGEKILVIEISDAAWTAPTAKSFASPIVQSYATQPLENGKGTRLIVTLKKAVTIVLDSQLPPEANNKNYRLVIDLKG